MKQSLTEKLYLAYRFEFEHNGHTITANASSLTGKEEILVDGVSVSKNVTWAYPVAISFRLMALRTNYASM
tara:strand:+ start:223 stop:435 length:213 start_codon:yes stop_codon:yes gene_type:complete